MVQRKEGRRKRKKGHPQSKRAAAFMFVGMIAAICLINMVTKDKAFSEKENRVLEQKPEITVSGVESGRFMDQYESYKSDQFAGRDFWVTVKTNLELLMGKRESGGVFNGKKSYLLEDIASPDEEQLSENLESMKAFRKKYPDIPFYMLLAPNAANVLSDMLPSLAVTESQPDQFNEIKKTLGTDFTWVDAQKALKAHTDKYIYYHTDHHWTTLGAYYAYQELAKSMDLDTSKAPELVPYAVTGDFNGTLSATSGYGGGYREPIYIYSAKNPEEDVELVVNYVDEQRKTATLYDSSKLEGKDKYAVFFGGNFSVMDIRTTADSTERLLVVKDSYANCLIPFLTPYYREIVVVDPRYYYGDIDKVMKENKITSVLFLYNGNTFMEDNSISGVFAHDKTE